MEQSLAERQAEYLKQWRTRPGQKTGKNALLLYLHSAFREAELAAEYRARDIDCEGDGGGEGTDTDPLHCQHCRTRARNETEAFRAISSLLEDTIEQVATILGVDDPDLYPTRPVVVEPTVLEDGSVNDHRWVDVEDAYDGCMAGVPEGWFGPYTPDQYD